MHLSITQMDIKQTLFEAEMEGCWSLYIPKQGHPTPSTLAPNFKKSMTFLIRHGENWQN
jgi:hypothetical protein